MPPRFRPGRCGPEGQEPPVPEGSPVPEPAAALGGVDVRVPEPPPALRKREPSSAQGAEVARVPGLFEAAFAARRAEIPAAVVAPGDRAVPGEKTRAVSTAWGGAVGSVRAAVRAREALLVWALVEVVAPEEGDGKAGDYEVLRRSGGRPRWAAHGRGRAALRGVARPGCARPGGSGGSRATPARACPDE